MGRPAASWTMEARALMRMGYPAEMCIAYKRQIEHVRYRGGEWRFSWTEWYNWWMEPWEGDLRRWDMKPALKMMRQDVKGPWSVDNVFPDFYPRQFAGVKQ